MMNDKILDNVKLILLTCAYSITIIMPNNTSGSIMMLLCILSVWFLSKYRYRKVPLVVDNYIKFETLFIAICFISLSWSIDRGLSLLQCKAVIQTIIMFWILYSALRVEADVRVLLKAMMWGAYIGCAYAILYYGFDKLAALGAEGERMESEFVNANVIGMASAMAIIISLYFQIYYKKSWTFLLNIIPFVILTASGSRKSLISLILGGSLLFIFKNQSKNKVIFVFKLCASLAILFVVIKLILSLDVFNTLNTRMDELIAQFTGKGEVDHSSMVREELRNIGFAQFLSTPFTGLGIDCPRYLALQYTGNFYYLHCNYAELLAGVGLFGCIAFYMVYMYGLVNLWKKRILKDKFSYIIGIMILIQLITDYGCVSYYERGTYFLIVTMFLQIRRLKILELKQKI